ncbi:cytotoxic translational repressor of toxin-antitoxin stability system [archaeon CG10_big_fil_rev_8_21_14_0_10_43_11]|nr:MAG: cytotoxic translational repressor of toxin-antitoxin stability system [archaeon CG10_big_fil_rev_8_21_14_0_10_43_11]
MYEIIFSPKALKFLNKLPVEIQKRIMGGLERSRIRPQSHFIRLVATKGYKMRIGDYRILADINQERLEILIIKIGHRKNVYK